MTALDLGLQPYGNRAAQAAIARRRSRAAWQRQRDTRVRASRLVSGADSRALFGWNPGGGDANVVLDDLPTVRERCRDAAVNSPIYRAVQRTLGDHAVGDTGLTPHSHIDHERLRVSETEAQDWQGAVDDLFKRHKDRADVTNQQDWSGLNRLALNSVFDGGDVFPAFPMTVGELDGVNRTRINLIEAERVDTPFGKASSPRLQFGVETNKWGAPVAYHVNRSHPGARYADPRHLRFERWLRTRAGRLNVIQLFSKDRVGQLRGVPFMNSSLDLVDKIPEYVDVTLEVADTQTRMSMWILSNSDPEDVASSLSNDDARNYYGSEFAGGVDPLAVNVLNKGDEPKLLGAQHPGSYFDPFIVRILRLICAVNGIPYAVAFSDTSNSNYSASRHERQTFSGVIAAMRKVILPMCRSWRAHLIYDAWLSGELPLVNFEADPDAWLNCVWTGPRIGHVDPSAEMSAWSEGIENKLFSRTEIIASAGGDRSFEDVARELAHEDAVLDKLGLKSPAPAAVVPPMGGDPEVDDEDDQADDADADSGGDEEDAES